MNPAGDRGIAPTHRGAPLLGEAVLWYTVRSCAGQAARRMLTFGALEADA
jgi:hypothetical protein